LVIKYHKTGTHELFIVYAVQTISMFWDVQLSQAMHSR